MNETKIAFKEAQEKNKQILSKLFEFVSHGRDLGVDIDESLLRKLENSIKEVENQKLKVVLVGGFSEGKTSIASAWLQRLEKSMNINHQESSDEVKIYNIDNDFELVDTPGLFGFKEKYTEASKIEKYKDITKKYVSEAHLVLYVLNSSNPIKESHKDDLVWLFRELNLLPRTIFVLSRFDEIADIEDEQNYKNELEIKQKNVTQRLSDFLNLSDEEKENLSIVAVAANPFDEGMEYWLGNIEELKKLSRIDNLQSKTKEKLEKNGGKLVVIEEAKQSIVNDVLQKSVPQAKEAMNVINKELTNLDEVARKTAKDLQDFDRQISASRIKLREFFIGYFSDLILQLNGTSLDNFNEFMIREVGDKGINIDTKIKNEFDKQTSRIAEDLFKIETNFDLEISAFERNVTSLGKSGVDFLKNSGVINAQNIKLARDGIVSVAKMAGFDLALKFKPWGAVNLASKANVALAVIGVGLEIWDSYKQHERDQKFLEAKRKMEKNFNQQKEEILALVNDDKSFKESFFPSVVKLENALNEIENAKKAMEQKKQDFESWLKSGEEFIDVECNSFVLKF